MLFNSKCAYDDDNNDDTADYDDDNRRDAANSRDDDKQIVNDICIDTSVYKE